MWIGGRRGIFWIVDQMKKAEGITEQLKTQNQIEWIQRMSNIQNQAMEIINRELIFE